MRPRPLTYLFTACAIYWAIRYSEVRGWGRLTMAIVMGFCALACEISNQADHEKRERIRWDD